MPGGSRKLQRSRKDKPYYEGYARKLSAQKIRRRGERDKRLGAATMNPGKGSPSQLKTRRKKGLISKRPARVIDQPF